MLSIYYRYTLIGFGFGLAFPLFALFADCFLFNDFPFSGTIILKRIGQNPIHYIILSAPFVLGFAAYQIGKSITAQKLITKRLERSNNAILHANELLDDFNYQVSHDLKSILNNQLALSGMIAKYVNQNKPEKVLEIANRLLEGGQNGLKTVMDFLKMSEEGFLNLDTSEVNFEVVLNQLSAENSLESKIEIKLGKREFESLKIAEKLLQTILLNLLTNSIKYSIKPPEVTIDLIRTSEGKIIVYRDNGIGIDLEKNGAQLFKPFNRIENDLKREGTGVGLYLIKKMIVALDGAIQVESKLGEGTTFKITFYSDITPS